VISEFAHVRSRGAGFTMVELVMVMVVIGVLSAVVMMNFNASAQHAVTADADQFRRNLSHVQLLAMSRSTRLRLTVAGDGLSYTVTSCTTSSCTATTAVTDPATGQNFSVALSAGVALAPAGDVVDFDSLGRPQSAGSLITANPARTYTLSGSGRSVTVSVLPVTGFAQTTY
jgi:prepilin-type N-terminal cleavage/methylation domain-containing protein